MGEEKRVKPNVEQVGPPRGPFTVRRNSAITLEVKRSDDIAHIYLNDQWIGTRETRESGPLRISLEKLFKRGRNSLEIQCTDYGFGGANYWTLECQVKFEDALYPSLDLGWHHDRFGQNDVHATKGVTVLFDVQ
ncbi:MAG TPA: hypothetical protein VEZ24_15565 [Microvirga sp.]|nr:hypothetical protein [Microvirga sp.]